MNNHIKVAISNTLHDIIGNTCQVQALIDIVGEHYNEAQHLALKGAFATVREQLRTVQSILGAGESNFGLDHFAIAVEKVLEARDYVTRKELDGALTAELNLVDWSDYDLVTSESLDGHWNGYLEQVDWSEYNVVTSVELGEHLDGYCTEECARDIAEEVVDSYEVKFRKKY